MSEYKKGYKKGYRSGYLEALKVTGLSIFIVLGFSLSFCIFFMRNLV